MSPRRLALQAAIDLGGGVEPAGAEVGRGLVQRARKSGRIRGAGDAVRRPRRKPGRGEDVMDGRASGSCGHATDRAAGPPVARRRASGEDARPCALVEAVPDLDAVGPRRDQA